MRYFLTTFYTYCSLILGISQNITEVQMIFTDNEGSRISATANGNAGNYQVNQDIVLIEQTDYTIQIILKDGEEDITNEISSDGNNLKMFYEDSLFIFGGSIYTQNTENRELPIGLLVHWSTNCVQESPIEGPFRTVLEDLTDVQLDNPGLGDGQRILDISWNIVLREDHLAPACNKIERGIDGVTLTFNPGGDGSPIIAVALDPDGPGPQILNVEPFMLFANTNYKLEISFENKADSLDFTVAIRNESNQYQIFFEWTEGLFSDPIGIGNIGNSSDPMNYEDVDTYGLPLGLTTSWRTPQVLRNGTFRIVLMHQPDLKSDQSGVRDGQSVVDITWPVQSVFTSSENSESLSRSIQLIPNIVEHQLRIEMPDFISQNLIGSLFDSTGRFIRSIDLRNDWMDVSDLNRGIYFLQIQINSGFVSKRFVKK